MKILIADAFSENHLEALRALGCLVDYRPSLGKADLPGAIADAQILVVRSTEVTAATIEAARDLALIVRAGAGVNTIDKKAASAKGIFVTNCPGKNSIAVAELAIGLLVSLDRRIADNVADLRAGKWNKKEYSKARGLHGRTLGILGVGAIGKEVARRALAFGMRVIAFDPLLDDATAEAMGIERFASLEDVCAAADAVSVHVPLGPKTRGLISASVIARLRPGAIFLNTSRAEVVDGQALQAAIVEKKLRVGLDVFDQEPAEAAGPFADPIVQLPGVHGTHHIGASTDQAQEAIADETVRIVRAFLERGEVENCVNLATRSQAMFQLVVRHLDRVGVLAEVLGAIRRHDINVQEMENVVFDGAPAASARIRLASRPPEALLEEIRGHHDTILHVACIELA